MSASGDTADGEIPQDPGIPGFDMPSEGPKHEPLESPPDLGPPDADDEGQLAES